MSNRDVRGVTTILIGLESIGLVGLPESIERVRRKGLADRERILDALVEEVAKRNYVPPGDHAAYRDSLWREHQRALGADIRDLYSAIEVEVAGPADEARDRFVETLRSVLADYELRPAVRYLPDPGQGPVPRLLIRGELVAQGNASRGALRQAIQKRISHW